MARTIQQFPLTAEQVAITTRIARKLRDAEWTAGRTQGQLWTYVEASTRGLRALDQHGLAADVRLPVTAVKAALWSIFRNAKAAHAARAAQPAAAEPTADSDCTPATACPECGSEAELAPTGLCSACIAIIAAYEEFATR
jgi:hypothetical protein